MADSSTTPTFAEFQAIQRRKESIKSRKKINSRPVEKKNNNGIFPSFGERVGNFVESPEVQFVVVLVIALDVAFATIELFIIGGTIPKVSFTKTSIKFLEYAAVFVSLALVIEIILLFVAFTGRLFDHFGYVVDIIIVLVSLYMQLTTGSRGLIIIYLNSG